MRFLKEIFGRARGPYSRSSGLPETFDPERKPNVGDIYGFRTLPYTKFAPLETGRFAAFKIVSISDEHIGVVVLSGIWDRYPSLHDVTGADILRENRFSWNNKVAAFSTLLKNWNEITRLDPVLVETLSLSAAEREVARGIEQGRSGVRYAAIQWVSLMAEGEWRWHHDRAAFEEEAKLKQSEDKAKRQAEQQRYDRRLKAITFDQLLNETQFESWTPSPPFPPQAFIEEARATLREACNNLQSMGPKPPKPKVRAVIKRTVEWFNEADVRYGEVIETEEREGIYLALEEMCHAAKQKDLVDEIDQWRNW